MDGVDIVTPADNHLAIARECFAKGKDVFVEKPIAFTSGEAREMVALAERGGLVLRWTHLPVSPCLTQDKRVDPCGETG